MAFEDKYHSQLLRIKIRPGCTAQVLEWLKGLTKRPEALAAMRRETMVIESAFFERVYTDDYLLFYTKAESMEKVMEQASAGSDPFTLELNQFIADNWMEVVPLETVFHLDRIDELKGTAVNR
ncbi:MAG: hypothetical protein AMXMBFR33_59930 [Candidatus Xenobia bacterium]